MDSKNQKVDFDNQKVTPSKKNKKDSYGGAKVGKNNNATPTYSSSSDESGHDSSPDESRSKGKCRSKKMKSASKTKRISKGKQNSKKSTKKVSTSKKEVAEFLNNARHSNSDLDSDSTDNVKMTVDANEDDFIDGDRAFTHTQGYQSYRQ